MIDKQTLDEKTGLFLHLQRLSTEDGPGIRTTVFMKGCPLRCGWCHNPESLLFKVQVQWLENRCIGCETCINACPNGCISMTPEGVIIDRDRCQGCGACAEACPANAMERLGTSIAVPELVHELVKDRSFYAASGGGVTISGGEPTMQLHFVAALLQELQQQQIHTAIDTCGYCSAQAFEAILPFTDLILFDLKEIDEERHRLFTGQPNGRIFENLILVRDYIHRSKQPHLWIRTPLIHGATATQENINGLGRFLADHLGVALERWELCAFNNLCRDKYRRLGMQWAYEEAQLMSSDELREWEDIAKRSGVNPEVVIATGATRVEVA